MRLAIEFQQQLRERAERRIVRVREIKVLSSWRTKTEVILAQLRAECCADSADFGGKISIIFLQYPRSQEDFADQLRVGAVFQRGLGFCAGRKFCRDIRITNTPIVSPSFCHTEEKDHLSACKISVIFVRYPRALSRSGA